MPVFKIDDYCRTTIPLPGAGVASYHADVYHHEARRVRGSPWGFSSAPTLPDCLGLVLISLVSQSISCTWHTAVPSLTPG